MLFKIEELADKKSMDDFTAMLKEKENERRNEGGKKQEEPEKEEIDLDKITEMFS